jgi:hypothetical protein
VRITILNQEELTVLFPAPDGPITLSNGNKNFYKNRWIESHGITMSVG